jgi:hypothetical protein
MLREYAGDQNINEAWSKLEKYFEWKADSLFQYFQMLDSRVAELKHQGGGQEMLNM